MSTVGSSQSGNSQPILPDQQELIRKMSRHAGRSLSLEEALNLHIKLQKQKKTKKRHQIEE